jgi:hypothetical protein
MPEFFSLSKKDQLEALNAVADKTGVPPHLLEKDIWVVWSLKQLFTGPFADHLVFKGGTSLSKAYGIIHRFSEDVDLTYDIREIAGDLIGKGNAPLPETRSQEKKWTKEIRERLAKWADSEIVPNINAALKTQKLKATAHAEDAKVFITYPPLASGTGYVAASVMLEFGARSTGDPCEVRQVVCDAAAHLTDLQFPTAAPRVMRAERTFWEKATAIHVFCVQGAFRGGERFSRHWHDLSRLDQSGFVDLATSDRELAKAVADHKSIFFAEKHPSGDPIDYYSAVSGSLKLVPEGQAMAVLAEDYQRMLEDGLLLDDEESFDMLIAKCAEIQKKVNAALTGDFSQAQ